MATGFRLSAPRDYRRGVVLGLTLAEVLVLLTFLLLLAMSALLLHKEREQAELRRQIEHDATIARAVEMVAEQQGAPIDNDRLANLVRDGTQADALRSQLREARERADAAAKAVAENEAMAALLERVPGLSSRTLVGKLTDLMRRDEGQVQKDQDLIKQDENLVGQNNQMRMELARVKGNGGSGLPYCWATADGKPEYMLKVDMHDEGVIIHDLDPRARPDDTAWRLLDPIARDLLMPLEVFMGELAPLKARETADRCRHAIEVVDSTGRTNKPGYKQSMGQLWSVFQLHEVR